jgi:hypothetical protein
MVRVVVSKKENNLPYLIIGICCVVLFGFSANYNTTVDSILDINIVKYKDDVTLKSQGKIIGVQADNLKQQKLQSSINMSQENKLPIINFAYNGLECSKSSNILSKKNDNERYELKRIVLSKTDTMKFLELYNSKQRFPDNSSVYLHVGEHPLFSISIQLKSGETICWAVFNNGNYGTIDTYYYSIPNQDSLIKLLEDAALPLPQ